MTKEEYEGYLKSRRWRIVRRIRLALDGGRCLSCFAANGERDRHHRQRWVEVHHRDYRWCNKGWLGGLLCEVADTGAYYNVCHRAIHSGNDLLEFLDMSNRPQSKMSFVLLFFMFFFVLGVVFVLYGWLAVVLALCSAGYMALMFIFFYRV